MDWPPLASGIFRFQSGEFDQLNKFLPHILLGFILYDYGVRADERRQGQMNPADLPGSDFDGVLGKYLGAVAIFSASIVISLLANYYVLGSWATLILDCYSLPMWVTGLLD